MIIPIAPVFAAEMEAASANSPHHSGQQFSASTPSTDAHSRTKIAWEWDAPTGVLIPVTLAQAAQTEAVPTKPIIDANQQSVAVTQPEEENTKMEVVWEWDPYYTDVGANIPLTSAPIPTIRSDNEAAIYSKLIQGSAIPRYMVLEASVYPLPILGTYLKKHSPGFYKQGEIGNTGFNLIESVTSGFQEPWAISAFFGNIAKLERPGETRSGTNYGYTGYLVSAGTKHIKDNVLIDDKWYELEWKIKGKINYPDEKLDWSFRFGGKFNANPYVTDVVYFGIHRSNLDYHAPFLSQLKNVSLDVKVQMAQHNSQIVRSEFFLGKKYPVTDKGFSPTLDIGLIWESPNEYTGVLRDRNHSTLTFLLRPSIEF
ncbi:MAG: hypothetical protein ACXWIN_04015 [Burkholderiaceae bacterium]